MNHISIILFSLGTTMIVPSAIAQTKLMVLGMNLKTCIAEQKREAKIIKDSFLRESKYALAHSDFEVEKIKEQNRADCAKKFYGPLVSEFSSIKEALKNKYYPISEEQIKNPELAKDKPEWFRKKLYRLRYERIQSNLKLAELDDATGVGHNYEDLESGIRNGMEAYKSKKERPQLPVYANEVLFGNYHVDSFFNDIQEMAASCGIEVKMRSCKSQADAFAIAIDPTSAARTDSRHGHTPGNSN